MKLSENTQQVFNAVQTYWDKNGFSPSVRDLMKMTGISSTSVIGYYLAKLEEVNLIQRVPGVARSITLVTKV